MDLINLLPEAKPSLLTCGWKDDFDCYVTGDRWTALAADGGASVAQDADDENGVVTITTGATDNNEAGIYTNAIGSMRAGVPHLLIARIQYAEANTDDANILFGLMSAAGTANMLIDDGAGPIANFTGACWYKVDGGTRWNFRSSYTTTPTTHAIDKTAGGASFQTLGIEINPISATEFEAIPWIDTSGGNNLVNPYAYQAAPRDASVTHRITYASTTALRAIIHAKAGGANSEVLKVDLAVFSKKRQ